MKVIIFGGTGSIGTQSLSVLKKQNHEILAISFFNNKKLANQLKTQYNIKYLIDLKHSTKKEVNAFIKKHKPDLIINAVSGVAGLRFSLLAIKNKIDLALANKESLVTAGQFIIPLAKKNKVNIYPIDSEHTALKFLIDNADKQIKDYYITASGGKFLNSSLKKLNKITFLEASVHPNWDMGYRITVDSSTLINKSFEVIEAYWLFNKKVKVLIQPQSHVHALLINKDKSVNCFISDCDMKISIALAINKFQTKPDTYIKKYKRIKDVDYQLLPIKSKHLKGYKYAQLMLNDVNGATPIIINAADEVAIELFKQNKIKFLDIYKVIDNCLKKFKNYPVKTVNDVFKLTEIVKKYIFI